MNHTCLLKGPELYRSRFETLKEGSLTFRLQVIGLETSAPGHKTVSDEKLKEGIFIGPQIREQMQDKQSDETWMKLKEMHGCLLRGFARTS